MTELKQPRPLPEGLDGARARQFERWGLADYPDTFAQLHPHLTRPRDALESHGLPRDSEITDKTRAAAKAGKLTWTTIMFEAFVRTVRAAGGGRRTLLRTNLLELASLALFWVDAIDAREKPEV